MSCTNVSSGGGNNAPFVVKRNEKTNKPNIGSPSQKPWEEEEDDIYGLMDAVRDGDRPEYDKNKKILIVYHKAKLTNICVAAVSNDESNIHHGRKKSVNEFSPYYNWMKPSSDIINRWYMN